MSLPATIDAMVAAGCTPEQLAAVVRVYGAAEEARVAAEAARVVDRRAKDARRTALYRERGGGAIPQDLRREVYERDDFTCVYCGSEEKLTCDHVLAVSRGGATTLDNLATACGPCNSRKRDRDRKFVQRHPADILGHPVDIEDIQGQTSDVQIASAGDLSPKKDIPPTPPIEKTTPIQSSLRSEFVSARHAEFYAEYPKKVEPKASLAKFIVAVRSGVDPERIIAAGKRFAEAHHAARTDRRYIPAPAVWLNRGGYDSEDLPTAPARAGPLNGHAIVKLSTARALMEMARDDEPNPSPGSLFDGESDSASAKPPIDGEFVEIA